MAPTPAPKEATVETPNPILAAFVPIIPTPANPPNVNAAPVAPPIKAPPSISPTSAQPVFPSRAEETPAVIPPNNAPSPIPINRAAIGKCPLGSTLLTGSLPQYAYKFKPLIL